MSPWTLFFSNASLSGMAGDRPRTCPSAIVKCRHVQGRSRTGHVSCGHGRGLSPAMSRTDAAAVDMSREDMSFLDELAGLTRAGQPAGFGIHSVNEGSNLRARSREKPSAVVHVR